MYYFIFLNLFIEQVSDLSQSGQIMECGQIWLTTCFCKQFFWHTTLSTVVLVLLRQS